MRITSALIRYKHRLPQNIVRFPANQTLDSTMPESTALTVPRRQYISPSAVKKPLVSFGVITDVQYADRDDCQAWYCKDKWRYYRSSLQLVEKAFSNWTDDVHPVAFCMQLGDVLDGCNKTMNLDSDLALRTTLEVFNRFPSIPTYHVVGNHELYNFGRDQLTQTLPFTRDTLTFPSETKENDLKPVPSGSTYYRFSPCEEVVILVIDCFDVALPGYKESDHKYKQAKETLKDYHTDTGDLESLEYDAHLSGLQKRFLSYNGAVGEDQLSWIDNQLKLADSRGQKVIVCGHISVHPDSTAPTCIVWNYQEVLDVFHKHRCVVAYFAGHLHDCGYTIDSHGIHHVTFAGIIETHPSDDAFSTAHVHRDGIEVVGYGKERSYTLPFVDSGLRAVPVETEPPSNCGMYSNSESKDIEPGAMSPIACKA